MAEPEQHPLDPEPPRPPGVPDRDLELPIDTRQQPRRTDDDETADGVPEPPD